MIKSSYTEAFREQAIERVLQRGHKTIQAIADELNVNHYTLKNWLKTTRRESMSKPPVSKRPNDWSAEERFQLLMESSGLEGEALNAFCRQKGLFSHHLDAWKKAFLVSQKTSTKTPSDKVLRDENKLLKKELNRKEKALAETAALLVLQKKFNAFWEEKVS
jgi:transposase-like protein